MCVFPLQKEEEEGEKSGGEEEVPEATERKEHASCGQTSVDSVQSVQAMELAGAAPEKEQGKEVRPHPQCLSVRNHVLFGRLVYMVSVVFCYC